VELLLCCHTCYQGTLISQAPAAPYPVVDPVVQSPSPREQQLAAQLRIEQTRADAYEVDALQAQLYRERIRKNDPDYKGVPEDYPRRKTEVSRRQSDQAKHWKAKYKDIKPSDKELNRLLSTYGPMKEVRTSLAKARRINTASVVSTLEEVPLLRQQVTDLRTQIAKNEENSMDATEVARLIEQAEAQITTKTEEMISDCLSKLESAERSNEISEEKRDALQEKYDELVDHLKDKERHTFEELRTGPIRSDGGGSDAIRLWRWSTRRRWTSRWSWSKSCSTSKRRCWIRPRPLR